MPVVNTGILYILYIHHAAELFFFVEKHFVNVFSIAAIKVGTHGLVSVLTLSGP